jgi:hypothetical protein
MFHERSAAGGNHPAMLAVGVCLIMAALRKLAVPRQPRDTLAA